jgi:hypothetical protein
MSGDFTIVFEQLEHHAPANATYEQADSVFVSLEDIAELDEVAELRRVAIEIAEPEPLSFTTT